MIRLKINNIDVSVKSNISVLEACKYLGIHVPRFCYHEILSVAGNCRFCLVEVANSIKPVASCALPVLNNMKVYVNTPLVKKARESILETLLINHPLDCPICDQGGECDLQDQVKLFGTNFSKFFFNKRSVEDKFCGPLIKTIMTRCIHCTRCVRFSSEIAGVEYLGTLNRGGSTEIGGYFAGNFQSEISGNVIDLCPVGALTAKPYAFKGRPWELRSLDSIDTTDSTGSNIYVHYKESEVLRVLPKINNYINSSIISDKARFSYDSNKLNRIKTLFIKNDQQKFAKSSWEDTLTLLESRMLHGSSMLFLVNHDLDLESLNILHKIARLNKNKIVLKTVKFTSKKDNLFVSWLVNKIEDVRKQSKLCLLISCNIRLESAILNSKLRLKYVNKDFKVFSINSMYSKFNYSVNFVNLNIIQFLKIFEGRHSFLCRSILSSKNLLVCIGESITRRGLSITQISSLLATFLSTVQILDIVSSCNSKSLSLLGTSTLTKIDLFKAKSIFLFNLENTLSLEKMLSFSLKNKELFWCSTHGSKSALKAKCILPILNHFEEEKNFYQSGATTSKNAENIVWDWSK